ncbi:MAG: RidA family protein [Candidatus Eremiobacteraeota bacterium]|jgi:2-iminobutanoate/2-iminopropanoate deaminase|nr:RidA family protein [Candidatus Eremiobacteraeota bacterium]
MHRRSIEVDGFGHGANPIPAASRVGNVVMTGGISGADPATGVIPEDRQLQVAHAFENLRRILEAAGAGPDDVVKVSVTVRAFDLRPWINEQWLAMFPDEHSRPARHVSRYDHFSGEMAIQLEAYAVIPDDDGR